MWSATWLEPLNRSYVSHLAKDDDNTLETACGMDALLADDALDGAVVEGEGDGWRQVDCGRCKRSQRYRSLRWCSNLRDEKVRANAGSLAELLSTLVQCRGSRSKDARRRMEDAWKRAERMVAAIG